MAFPSHSRLAPELRCFVSRQLLTTALANGVTASLYAPRFILTPLNRG